MGLGLVLSLLLASVADAAIQLGRLDDFQNGTTQGWAGGSSPTNIATGGPAGTGDRFLRINTANGKLATFNATWGGDWLAAGVTQVAMDLNNLGTTELEIRLLLVDAGVHGGNFTSAHSLVLPAMSGWVHAVFSLAPDQMAYIGGGVGSGVLSDTLAHVDRLLIRNDPGAPSPAGEAPSITGTLGLDNLHAIPEPTAAAALLIGAAAMMRRRGA
jgi:hypothetical protein